MTTYTYDDRNRLTQVTVGGTIVATYTYDALNRRIGFDDNGTQTWVVFDGSSPFANPYADFNGSGTLLTRYVSGPAIDELFARTSSGGTSAWYLTDRLGTVRDIANTSGTVIYHVVYDSYGNVTPRRTRPTGIGSSSRAWSSTLLSGSTTIMRGGTALLRPFRPAGCDVVRGGRREPVSICGKPASELVRSDRFVQ